MKFYVRLWGCLPWPYEDNCPEDRDLCIDEVEFGTLEDAIEAFECYWSHFSMNSLSQTTHAQLFGPLGQIGTTEHDMTPYEALLKHKRERAERAADQAERAEARNMAGMAFGVRGANEYD